MKIKNILRTIAISVALACSSAAKTYGDTIAHVKQTRVISAGERPIDRTEVIARSSEYKSDMYFIEQTNGKKGFTKARLQYLPLDYNKLSAGLTGNYFNNGTKSDVDFGLVARFKDTSNRSLLKSDIRYFPSDNHLATTTIFDNEKYYAELVGSYNHGKITLVSNFNFKLYDNFSVGVEGKFSGNLSSLEKKYVGLRACLEF